MSFCDSVIACVSGLLLFAFPEYVVFGFVSEAVLLRDWHGVACSVFLHPFLYFPLNSPCLTPY